jgi:hypothetical protein
MNLRTTIRYYCKQLLLDADIVGQHVFLNRPTVVNEEEIPAILVYFEDEPVTLLAGSEDNPDQYRRDLTINVDVIVQDALTAEGHSAGEDAIDALGDQIEQAMFDDYRFAKLIPGYNANTNYTCGLLLGLRLLSVRPFDVDTEGDRRIIGQRLQFQLPYQKPAVKDKKYDAFLQFYDAVTRVDSDEDTTDRVLIDGIGELDQ